MTEQTATDLTDQPNIAAVRPGPGRTVYVTWQDGSEHQVDVSDLIRNLAVFAPLDDDAAFRQVTVGDWGWSLHWTDDAELSSDTVLRMALEQDAERFRAWRKGHGLTQATAADALGLGLRMLKYYEAGSHPIPKTVKLATIGYDTVQRGRAA